MPSDFQKEQGSPARLPCDVLLPGRGPDWQGLRGYVQEHIASIAQGRADMHAYISGLDKMIKSNCDLLQELGWDRKSISFEKYD